MPLDVLLATAPVTAARTDKDVDRSGSRGLSLNPGRTAADVSVVDNLDRSVSGSSVVRKDANTAGRGDVTALTTAMLAPPVAATMPLTLAPVTDTSEVWLTSAVMVSVAVVSADALILMPVVVPVIVSPEKISVVDLVTGPPAT